jgi:NADPH:quinone reductase-like Zn-dependent oxidoreductase
MRALVIRQFGEPKFLKVEEVLTPRAGEGEAVVKVMAAGINPSDVKNVQGKMHGTTLPRIPGRDFAGVVVEGPPDRVGREVWGSGGDIGYTRDGSHAQFIRIPSAALALKPKKLTMDEAGSAGLVFVTGWASLVSAANVSQSDCALVIGAGGGVGFAAVQVAKAKGAKVIGAVQSEEDATEARGAGADFIVNTRSEKLTEGVQKVTDGYGANVVLDTSGSMFAECVEAAAMGGRISVITAPPDGNSAFNLRMVYRKELRIFGVDTRGLDVTASAKLLAQMSGEFESGAFKVKLGQPRPLAEVPAAYEDSSRGKGRIYLRPNG